MVKKAAEKPAQKTADELLQEKLAGVGLADTLGLVHLFPSAHVSFTRTSFPSLDNLLHPLGLGLAEGRDVEIFSRDGSAGKTTGTLQILVAWQQVGKATALCDVEGTITEDYLNLLGVVTRFDPSRPHIIPVRMISHTKDARTGKMIRLSLEEVFNAIILSSDIFDLIVVDSVDALMEKSQADKTADENQKQGGISKKLSEYFRKGTAKKSTILWINQTRQSMAYSPTGQTTYVTTGGRAMRFYSSIRLELSVVKRLAEGDKDPYGFTTKFTTVKNKLGYTWRSCELNYIFGEGFSIVYDYFKVALAQKIIVKSGSWLASDVLDLKAQGEKKMYDLLKSNYLGSFDKLKQILDGESIVEIGEADEELKRQEDQIDQQIMQQVAADEQR